MPISHVMIKSPSNLHSDLVAFYTQALLPLGYSALKRYPSGVTGFGAQTPDLWIAVDAKDSGSTIHFAFAAPDVAAVDAFFEAALEAGGKDNGKPGPRPGMDEKYYAAFVYDLAGNNIEVGCMVE